RLSACCADPGGTAMPRVCTVCAHQSRQEIDAALTTGAPYRRIAPQYGLTERSVRRHAADHIPAMLAQAAQAKVVTQAGDLLTQVQTLQAKALDLLAKAEAAGDYRTALAGVREARGTLELLARLRGELDERAVVNVLLAPDWLAVRAAL